MLHPYTLTHSPRGMQGEWNDNFRDYLKPSCIRVPFLLLDGAVMTVHAIETHSSRLLITFTPGTTSTLDNGWHWNKNVELAVHQSQQSQNRNVDIDPANFARLRGRNPRHTSIGHKHNIPCQILQIWWNNVVSKIGIPASLLTRIICVILKRCWPAHQMC